MPAATLNACRVVRDEAGGLKPSCNFHFRCLKQVDDINLGGCLGKFSKNLSYQKKIPTKLRNFFLKNQFFANFSKQIVFFYVKFAFRITVGWEWIWPSKFLTKIRYPFLTSPRYKNSCLISSFVQSRRFLVRFFFKKYKITIEIDSI